MSYSITVSNLPAGSGFYVEPDANNPKTIEADKEVTLRFTADGVFYYLIPILSAAVQVTGASIVSWNVPDFSGTYGELTINNPTGDVNITITAQKATTPTTYNKPFQVNGKFAIDTRMVLSKYQMTQVKDNTQPEVYFAICSDDAGLYIYDKNAEKLADTGRYRRFEGVHNVIVGYYLNGKFYTDSTYTIECVKNESFVYIDKNTFGQLYMGSWNEDHTEFTFTSSLPEASSVKPGLVKLYDEHGENTDGTMTQKAITDGVNSIKFDVEDTDDDGDVDCLILDLPWD